MIQILQPVVGLIIIFSTYASHAIIRYGCCIRHQPDKYNKNKEQIINDIEIEDISEEDLIFDPLILQSPDTVCYGSYDLEKQSFTSITL